MQTLMLVICTVFAVLSVILYSKSSKDANLPYYMLLLSFIFMYLSVPSATEYRYLMKVEAEMLHCKIKKQNCIIEIRGVPISVDATGQ